MNDDLNQQSVQGPDAEGVSAPAVETPVSQEGVGTPPTPVQKPDVDVKQLITKYEKDINSLKSTLQRREAQVNADWQKKYDGLQRTMHETRMQGMTDEERDRYERQLDTEQMQTLQQRVEQVEVEKQQLMSAVNAQSFFIQQGVPADKLNLAEGYDAVVNGGWEFLTSELARLREAVSNPQPQKPVEPTSLKEAPRVITDKGVPASGTTWAALRAQFGTDEAIYRAVEEGRLDPSVIPSG